MKYACLVYFEGSELASLTRAESDALTRDSLDYDRELDARGHLLLAHALQSPEEAITVRVRGGRMSTTDGPFAETKEQLGGFVLVEARDLNEAVQLASRIPRARIGCIEVRPVLELSYPQLDDAAAPQQRSA